MSVNDTPTPEEEVGASAEADTPVAPSDAPQPDIQPSEDDTPESGDGEAGEVSEDLGEEADPLGVLEAENAELRDQLLRARADYDNLNKRRAREVTEARDRGAAVLAGNLVDVLDSFSMALAAASQSGDEQMAKGVQLVYDQLMNALIQSGMEPVPGVGAPFDPKHHEAVHAEEDDQDRDVPEVIDVLRAGWTFKGQLLRAATVRVVN